MADVFLRIYDFLQSRRRLCSGVVVVLFFLLLVLTLRLNYKEDIYDFLPFSDNYQREMSVYQCVSQADKIFVVFQRRDSTAADRDELTGAVDEFAAIVAKRDTAHLFRNLVTQVDYDDILEITGRVYEKIPYYLTLQDYRHIDSLLTPEYVRQQVERDRQLLMFPTGAMLSDNIGRDPLNLFTPVVSRLQGNGTMQYELYNGYIFSSDYKLAYVMFSTPFGASETANNTRLVSLLDDIMDELRQHCPGVDVHSVGAPVIAVGNATQIKKDSILAVCLAVTLIIILLIYSFRSIRNIMLIGVSIVFGWLFAMSFLSLTSSSVSLIVLGIASVIVGIAVNYPLHLVDHLNHEPNVRNTLKVVVAPLLIGNITTVGAFLCLIPLDAPAMKDLGLFSSFMLIGTILFVLVFLPHFIRANVGKGKPRRVLLTRLVGFSFEGRRWTVLVVTGLTCVFGYFSLFTSFDADIRNINYMTEEQRQDLYRLENMAMADSTISVYLMSQDRDWSTALSRSESLQAKLDSMTDKGLIVSRRSAVAFFPSLPEQQRRLQAWNDLMSRKRDLLTTVLYDELARAGFDPSAFKDYDDIITNDYEPIGWEEFKQLAVNIFASNIFADSVSLTVVDVLDVPHSEVEHVEQTLNEKYPDTHCFDVNGMNRGISNTLSDNFNYICFSCGFIVFVFLWLSFGRLELAFIAFLPMVIGWIWILGIMQVFGIQFNIVNVILATFIFGQGDDYTIFMTEGLIYEHAYKRRLLASYKNSIVISALIMFIGIGSLIVARHPALHSLAEVTIVGMFSVVFMAYFVPPFVYGWLVRHNGRERQIPVTIERIVVTAYSAVVYITQILIGLLLGLVLFPLGRKSRWARDVFHRYINCMARLDARCIYGVRVRYENHCGEDFTRGAIIVCNHQSILDSLFIMGVSRKVLVMTNSKVWNNPVIHCMLRMADFLTTSNDMNDNLDKMRRLIDDGYCVVVFPEGKRISENVIHRFHKGAFYMAERLKADIVPIYLHGVGHVMPSGSALSAHGVITIAVGGRIAASDSSYGLTYQERTRNVHRSFCAEYEQLKKRLEVVSYFGFLIRQRYLYKGNGIERRVRRELRCISRFASIFEHDYQEANIVVVNNGIGVVGLLLAYSHARQSVYAFDSDADNVAIAGSCSLPRNLRVAHTDELTPELLASSVVFLMNPSPEQSISYSKYNLRNIYIYI